MEDKRKRNNDIQQCPEVAMASGLSYFLNCNYFRNYVEFCYSTDWYGFPPDEVYPLTPLNRTSKFLNMEAYHVDTCCDRRRS